MYYVYILLYITSLLTYLLRKRGLLFWVVNHIIINESSKLSIFTVAKLCDVILVNCPMTLLSTKVSKLLMFVDSRYEPCYNAIILILLFQILERVPHFCLYLYHFQYFQANLLFVFEVQVVYCLYVKSYSASNFIYVDFNRSIVC